MTGRPVADELLGRAATKWHGIYGKLKSGGFGDDPEQVLGALQAIFDGRFALPGSTEGTALAPVARQRPRLIHSRYTPIAQQVKNLWRWNKRYGWGLPKGWDEKLDVPEWTDDPLVSINVVAFLEAKGGILGEHRTFDAYWEIIRGQHPNHDRNPHLLADPDHLRLLPGITHVPGVRIEVIDHGANWNKETGLKPIDVRSPDTSPHAGLLASLAHHPKRIRKMDGTTVPFEWIAGYQCSVPGSGPWRDVPIASWGRADRQVYLYVNWGGHPRSAYAVPVLRRLSAGSGAR